jgi:pilus assembly protein CpaE
MVGLVEAQPDMELVDTAETGHEGLRRALELQPDIILMDVHMPDMDGIQATWLISNKSPNGAVIMVTSEERVDFLQRAMAAGAQGYVLKPFGDGAQLLQTMRDAYDRGRTRRTDVGEVVTSSRSSAPPRLGKRVVVFGGKGGIGKTSLAVNLALWMRQTTQQSVIIFDADLHFGDVNVHLDLPAEHTILDLLPNIDSLDSSLVDQVVCKHSSGVHVLARPPRPEHADVIFDRHIRSILSVLANTYDHVIIDTQASYDERMLAVLDLADVYVVVLIPDLGPLRDTRHFIEVAGTLGYPEDHICFVLNRANSLAGLTMDDISTVLGTRRVLQIPSVGTALSRSINDGQPLILSQPRSAYGKALALVGDRVRLLTDRVPSATG